MIIIILSTGVSHACRALNGGRTKGLVTTLVHGSAFDCAGGAKLSGSFLFYETLTHFCKL